MVQVSQLTTATHTIAHFSDPHFLGGLRPLHGSIPTNERLAQALSQLETSGVRPDAILFTGDLAHEGEKDAYSRLRELVEPVANRLGSTIVWVMGNHDVRAHYSRLLFDLDPSNTPQDRVYNVNGVRIVTLDTSVPGHGHGDLAATQLDWLRNELATPAEQGTILAMHHPPTPTPLEEALGVYALRSQDLLAEAIRDSDIRAILAGHLHYSSHSSFGGIPVTVAAATCFTFDLSAQDRVLSGRDFGQSFNIVHLYESGAVYSTIPIGEAVEVTGHSAEEWAQITR